MMFYVYKLTKLLYVYLFDFSSVMFTWKRQELTFCNVHIEEIE